MGQVPFKQQRLRRDALQFLQHERSLGNEIGGETILRAVEQFAGKAAPIELRELLLETSIPQQKPNRGRPPNHAGQEDFVLEQVNRIYPWLLRRYQNRNASKAERMPPSERAYRLLAKMVRRHLKNIDWKTLRNKHTDWKLGRFYRFDKCTDSEAYEADIETQFPTPTAHNNEPAFP